MTPETGAATADGAGDRAGGTTPEHGLSRWGRRAPWVLGVAGVLALLGGVVLFADPAGSLTAVGPTSVSETEASAPLAIAGAPVREIHYRDHHRFDYRFTLRNDGLIGVTATGIEDPTGHTSLIQPEQLANSAGRTSFYFPAGGAQSMRLTALMSGCEHIEARGAGLLTEIQVQVRVLGLIPRTVTVPLPERLRSGSPRDSGCPGSSHHTRSPG